MEMEDLAVAAEGLIKAILFQVYMDKDASMAMEATEDKVVKCHRKRARLHQSAATAAKDFLVKHSFLSWVACQLATISK